MGNSVLFGKGEAIRNNSDYCFWKKHPYRCCIWSVIPLFSNHKQRFSPLRLFCHILLKRDHWHCDWRLRLNDTPNAIDKIAFLKKNPTSFPIIPSSKWDTHLCPTGRAREKPAHLAFVKKKKSKFFSPNPTS